MTLVKRILTIIITVFTIYLLGSFIAATFNIAEWTSAGRYAIGCMMALSAVFVFGVSSTF